MLKSFSQNIQPLKYHNLRGRVLRIPAAKKTKSEVLFIYGSHASLERIVGVAKNLAQSANITVPDLPGFGGMTSLYRLPRKALQPRHAATFDELGDYVAWFIRENYDKKTKIDLIGMSLGFAIVTRMLQRNPDIIPRIRNLVSYVGFANYRDFRMKSWKRRAIIELTWLFERAPFAWFMRHTFCTRPALRLVYGHTKNEKFENVDFDSTLDMEVSLWQQNDVRTYMRTINEMFRLDDLRKVPLPVTHIEMAADRYFDNSQVETSMRKVFTDFATIRVRANNHAPSVIADADAATDFVPRELHDLLR